MTTSHIYDRLTYTSAKSGIPTRKMLDFFFYLKSGNLINNNELIQKLGVARNVLNQVKKEFSDLLEPVSQNTQLKKEFLNEISSLFETSYKTEGEIFNFQGLSTLSHDGNLKRLDPIRKYDQFIATNKTVIKISESGEIDVLQDPERCCQFIGY